MRGEKEKNKYRSTLLRTKFYKKGKTTKENFRKLINLIEIISKNELPERFYHKIFQVPLEFCLHFQVHHEYFILLFSNNFCDKFNTFKT